MDAAIKTVWLSVAHYFDTVYAGGCDVWNGWKKSEKNQKYK